WKPLTHGFRPTRSAATLRDAAAPQTAQKPCCRKHTSDFTWSPISTLEWLEVSQRGNHVFAEQPQRVHQVRLGHRGAIELAEKRIERPLARPRLELAGDCFGRPQ